MSAGALQGLREAIMDSLPEGAQVSVELGGQHCGICVVSSAFLGKNRVQQHQMIYKVIEDKIGKELHSVSIQTFTPKQWQARKDLRLA